MKNIYEILKGIGIEIPEDKKESFDKALVENYKTISEVNGINAKLSKTEQERDTYKTKYDEDIATRDNDLKTLQDKLKEAGVDKTKLEELTTQLSSLQNTYDNAKTDYEKKLAAQKYEFLVKDSASTIKFSSNSAKKTFIADVLEKNLPVENDKLLGFEDFVNAYKEQDAGAFVIESDNNNNSTGNKPHFSSKSNIGDDGNNNNNADGGEASKTMENPLIW